MICDDCIHEFVCLYLHSWEELKNLKKISDFNEEMEEIELCFYYYSTEGMSKVQSSNTKANQK